MTTRKFWIVASIYTALFVAPPLLYFVTQFYMYLFDGWRLSEKMGSAAMWLLAFGCVGYLILAMCYDMKHDRWEDK